MQPSEHDDDDKVGPFQILRLLGMGGMAQVYHAVKKAEGIPLIVALKIPRQHIVMDETAREHFLREARTTARMGTHANIVAVSDVGVDNGLPYMALEYVTGANLAQLCKAMAESGHQWDEREILWVIAGILQGLKHAWGAVVAGKPLRIVHRDISPSNIMLTHEGYVKITDFGISQIANVENSGSIRGKYRYMPLEQLQGRATSASDIFAVGAIAWELLEGKKFRHDKTTENDMVLAAYNGEVPEITRTDVSPRFVQFVYALLDPNEKTRLQNAMDAWAALKACPGVNVVDPEPVETLVAEYFGQRRSGCTDVDTVVIHPELIATRAALRAAARSRNTDQAREGVQDPQEAAPSTSTERGPTLQLEAESIPWLQTSTAKVPPPPLLVVNDHVATMPHTAADVPSDGRASASPPHENPTPVQRGHRPPATEPMLAAHVPPVHRATVPTTIPLTAAPGQRRQKRHRRYWLVLAALPTLAASAFAIASLRGPPEDEILPAVATNASVTSTPTPEPTTNADKKPATAEPRPSGDSDSDAPANTKTLTLAALVAVATKPAPASNKPEGPATQTPSDDADTAAAASTSQGSVPDPETPEQQDKPSPQSTKDSTPDRIPVKPKAVHPRAIVDVRLNFISEAELRIGKKVKHIAGDTRLRLRPGTRKLAVRKPGSVTWYSASVKLDPGREYVLFLWDKRLSLKSATERPRQ